MAARTGVARKVLLRYWRVRVFVRFDRVDSVAIGTDRGEVVTVSDRLAVNADVEGVLNIGMALTARCRHAGFVDGRLRIVCRKNGMRAVAIGANRCLHRTAFDGAPVHALLIGEEHLRAYAIRLHQKLLPVAAAAGGRDMCVIDRRIGVPPGQNRVSVSVTVQAVRTRKPYPCDLCMHAVRVRIGCIGVARGAKNFLRRRFVREALHVLVAIDASQFHRAVDGVLKLLSIYEQRDWLSIHIFAQRCVTVTGEAVLIFQLVLGANGEGRAQQIESQRTEQDSAGNFHAYEETPAAFESP